MRGKRSWRRRRDVSMRPQNANAQPGFRLGVLYRALAMTYFLTGNPQYHRRCVVSRSCSGWEGVGPTRYGRREFWDWKVVTLGCVLHRVAIDRSRTQEARL